MTEWSYLHATQCRPVCHPWYSVYQTLWKYVFDITSLGQHPSPWSCNSVKVKIKFNLFALSVYPVFFWFFCRQLEMVMAVPTPQCVGREFVRQYYTLLNREPLQLHRYYADHGVEKLLQACFIILYSTCFFRFGSCIGTHWLEIYLTSYDQSLHSTQNSAQLMYF